MNPSVVPYRADWGPIPVDSDAEMDAVVVLLGSSPIDPRTVGQKVSSDHPGFATDQIAAGDHDLVFDVTSYVGTAGLIRGETMTTETLDLVTRRAQAFSVENPPHHPGTVARFPIPSRRYRSSIEVPLAVVAIDHGERGIYAPPRVALLSWPESEPAGVGEFPGFDPGDWPPPRLGPWPPLWVGDVPGETLRAAVARFSACWVRILDAAIANELERVSRWDREHARSLRGRLDLPGMAAAYRALNPEFEDWLIGNAAK